MDPNTGKAVDNDLPTIQPRRPGNVDGKREDEGGARHEAGVDEGVVLRWRRESIARFVGCIDREREDAGQVKDGC